MDCSVTSECNQVGYRLIRRPKVVGPPSPTGTESESRTRREAFETIHLRPGLEMSINSKTNPGGLKVGFEVEKPPLSLSYNLSLPMRSTMAQAGRRSIVMERGIGDSLMAYLPETKGFSEVPPGCLNGVSLYFSLETLAEYFSPLPDCLREVLCSRFLSPGPRLFSHRGNIGWDTYLVLRQILECQYEGDTRRIFLEAKALELLCHKLAEMGQDREQHSSGLTHRELDLAREAHHILLSRLEQPPSLDQLGVMVGLNRNKLNCGFKQLFGDTVFQVLHKARLSKARIMLGDPDYSLSEIALAVGYSDQANFSNAFRRHFGQTPRTARRELTGAPAVSLRRIETAARPRP